jgi:hypothetical protein
VRDGCMKESGQEGFTIQGQERRRSVVQCMESGWKEGRQSGCAVVRTVGATAVRPARQAGPRCSAKFLETRFGGLATQASFESPHAA